MEKKKKLLLCIVCIIFVVTLVVLIFISTNKQISVETVRLSYSGKSTDTSVGGIYSSSLKGFGLNADVSSSGGFSMSLESNGSEFEVESDIAESSYDYDSSSSSYDSSSESKNLTDGKKLKKVYNYSVESTEYNKFTSDFESKVDSLGGYVEDVDKVQRTETNSMRTETYTVRRSSYTVRVPSGKINELLTLVENGAYVKSQKENIEDVTVQYIDTEAHIDALIEERHQLERLLTDATDIDDLLSIQNRISDVEYEIESYTNILEALSHDVDYSKLYLTVDEVIYYEDTVTRFKSDIVKEWDYIFEEWLSNVAPTIVLIAISLVPMFILFFLVAGISISVISKRVYKNKMKYQQTLIIKTENEKIVESNSNQGTDK